MAWITAIDYEQAEGELRRHYDLAIKRGRVYNIVKIMGLRPAHLKASIDLYLAVMHGPGGLTRAQREMLAVAVSKANDCHY
jgi:alkylhydroperoxidase family enzyme